MLGEMLARSRVASTAYDMLPEEEEQDETEEAQPSRQVLSPPPLVYRAAISALCYLIPCADAIYFREMELLFFPSTDWKNQIVLQYCALFMACLSNRLENLIVLL